MHLTREECCLSVLNGLLTGAQVANSNSFLQSGKLNKLYDVAIEAGSEMFRRLQEAETPNPDPHRELISFGGKVLAMPDGFETKVTGVVDRKDLVAMQHPLQWVNPLQWMLGKPVSAFLSVTHKCPN